MARIAFNALKTEVGEAIKPYEIVLEDADPASGQPERVLSLRPALRLPEEDRLELDRIQKVQNEKEKVARDEAKAYVEYEKALNAWVDDPENNPEPGEEPVVNESPDAAGESIEYLRTYITLVADDKELVAEFLSLVGDDLGFLFHVVRQYGKETQLGEVSPSAN